MHMVHAGGRPLLDINAILFIFYALLIFYFSYENHLDRDDVMSFSYTHSSPGLR